MIKNKKTLFFAILLATFSLSSILVITPKEKVFGATNTLADTDSYQDFHIDKYGKVTIRQAKVYQVAGTTYYIRYYVGTAFLRVLLKTDDKTKAYRKFGDEITLDQIKAGDVLNIDGAIETGSDTLSIVASKITNFSNQKAISSFTGTIVGIGSTSGSFSLKTKSDTITINTGTTTQIKKGNRIITPDLVKNGDQIIDSAGTFDYGTKTLDAKVIVVYVDMKTFNERNFEGKLKSVNNTGDTPVLVINTEGKDYKVYLKKPLIILNKAKNPVSIKRYLEGDTVRVYGAIRETEEPIIDAEVVRNVDLQ